MLQPQSARLPVQRSLVDRDVPTRLRPDSFMQLLAEPATRVMLLSGPRVLGDAAGPVLLPVSAITEDAITDDAIPDDPITDGVGAGGAITGAQPAQDAASAVPANLAAAGVNGAVYLGRSIAEDVPEPVGTPIVAVAVSKDAAERFSAQTPDAAWLGLRESGEFSIRDRELLAQAVALFNWHGSHRFSPRTGRALSPVQSGWVLQGADPSHEVYPRIDPSVIVAVIDADDRILLGSNAMWASNRFSLLAGFVEPGESLEGAVEREIFEESGIHVTDAQYLGSQSWPFPASLMLGFTARVDPERPSELRPDGEEILALRWFSRDELVASLDEIVLPGRASIARAIIEHWFGGPLPDGAERGGFR